MEVILFYVGKFIIISIIMLFVYLVLLVSRIARTNERIMQLLEKNSKSEP